MPESDQPAVALRSRPPSRAASDVALALPTTHEPGCWRGAVEWCTESAWATAWRLPRTEELRDPLRRAAESATGVRAEFRTDARALTLPIRVSETADPVLDVRVDGELVHRQHLADDSTEMTVRLPGVPSEVEVWLPHDGVVRVGSLELSDADLVELDRTPRPRWHVYGSSITHCLASSGPSTTWPARVARSNGWDLTCLGFNGQAMLDLSVARTIAAAAPELVSLCVGINIFNQGLMGPSELAERLGEFVGIITDAGATAVSVMSPIASPTREVTANPRGMTLVGVRELLAEIVQGLGAPVSYVHGPDVLGEQDAGLLSDGLHPDSDGYDLMARRLAPLLAERWS